MEALFFEKQTLFFLFAPALTFLTATLRTARSGAEAGWPQFRGEAKQGEKGFVTLLAPRSAPCRGRGAPGHPAPTGGEAAPPGWLLEPSPPSQGTGAVPPPPATLEGTGARGSSRQSPAGHRAPPAAAAASALRQRPTGSAGHGQEGQSRESNGSSLAGPARAGLSGSGDVACCKQSREANSSRATNEKFSL